MGLEGFAHGPILPAWLVVPTSLLLLMAVAVHMHAMRDAPMPESRRRIRTANGWLMLLTVPLATYAFCMLRTDNPRLFVLVWAAVVGLVGLVVMVAMVDMLNNVRLASLARKRLREHVRLMQQILAARAASPHAASSGSPGLASHHHDDSRRDHHDR